MLIYVVTNYNYPYEDVKIVTTKLEKLIEKMRERNENGEPYSCIEVWREEKEIAHIYYCDMIKKFLLLGEVDYHIENEYAKEFFTEEQLKIYHDFIEGINR
ncbi:hypothetical protein ABEW81_11375 [Priestia megaterium]